ncbi:V-type ATP synthase subunit D [Nitrosophilus alvini]|uniref:V-type ATP synthase subunit D n=1 Tax=Nitrosophilus alvini TaxID=2714855 RepID=UPI00190C172D|nr:V-type ATP synthase subunit D [Nitrosophilus alvini]
MARENSKTALLELKTELEVASGGEEILEQKRNILLKEIISLLDVVDEKRKIADEMVVKSYRHLIKAFMESGYERVEKESALVKFDAELSVVSKSFIGIVVPEVYFKKKKKELPVGYVSESVYIDIARNSFAKALELILELSSIEIKVWRLAEELKKTVIRVNALKNYYLPKYKNEIKRISSSLEESEREFLAVLKILQKRIEPFE